MVDKDPTLFDQTPMVDTGDTHPTDPPSLAERRELEGDGTPIDNFDDVPTYDRDGLTRTNPAQIEEAFPERPPKHNKF